MGKLKPFVFGTLLGSAMMFMALQYHVVRSHDGLQVIPRTPQQSLGLAFADVRQWNATQWTDRPELARALLAHGSSDLISESVSNTLNDAVSAEGLGLDQLKSVLDGQSDGSSGSLFPSLRSFPTDGDQPAPIFGTDSEVPAPIPVPRERTSAAPITERVAQGGGSASAIAPIRDSGNALSGGSPVPSSATSPSTSSARSSEFGGFGSFSSGASSTTSGTTTSGSSTSGSTTSGSSTSGSRPTFGSSTSNNGLESTSRPTYGIPFGSDNSSATVPATGTSGISDAQRQAQLIEDLIFGDPVPPGNSTSGSGTFGTSTDGSFGTPRSGTSASTGNTGVTSTGSPGTASSGTASSGTVSSGTRTTTTPVPSTASAASPERSTFTSDLSGGSSAEAAPFSDVTTSLEDRARAALSRAQSTLRSQAAQELNFRDQLGGSLPGSISGTATKPAETSPLLRAFSEGFDPFLE
ncbi:MAG: hypothetical protein KDA85_22310 [Planctomycetaceae bacterium]|nr:hypothetical protein [Planctomycetaceae bacterium]